jgi:hypothetical protein
MGVDVSVILQSDCHLAHIPNAAALKGTNLYKRHTQYCRDLRTKSLVSARASNTETCTIHFPCADGRFHPHTASAACNKIVGSLLQSCLRYKIWEIWYEMSSVSNCNWQIL